MEIILNYCCKGENSTILIPSLSSDFPFISSRIGNKTVIPALGLAWSSMVTTRLMLSRTEQLIQPNDGVSPWFYQNHFYHLKMRNFLSVSFAAVVLWEERACVVTRPNNNCKGDKVFEIVKYQLKANFFSYICILTHRKGTL